MNLASENFSRPALAVFVKTPGLSPIKTRLASAWGISRVLEFYEHCLRCSGELFHALVEQGWSAHWAVAESADQWGGRWSEFPALAQGDGGLGSRMAQVLNTLLRIKASAMIMGSDIPQAQPRHLQSLADALATADVVLGPARDGGFWALGSKVPLPVEVLDSISYSQSDTRQNFIRALRQWNPNLNIVEDLPKLRDVDDATDALVLPSQLNWGNAQRALKEWLAEKIPKENEHGHGHGSVQ